MKPRLIGAAMLCSLVMTAAVDGAAWDITGGEVWQNRTGPGVLIAPGFNGCTNEYCDSVLDVKFGKSFGSTFEFYYRVIPNLVAFADIHLAYISTNYDNNPAIIDDKGFLFQTTVGAAFHAPINGWLDAYVGLGLGYALLRFKGIYRTDDTEQILSLRGFNTELRFGADVYPISTAPTFGVGPILKIGFAAWPKACYKDGDSSFDCRDPDDHDIRGFEDVDKTPFLVFFGVAVRYGF